MAGFERVLQKALVQSTWVIPERTAEEIKDNLDSNPIVLDRTSPYYMYLGQF